MARFRRLRAATVAALVRRAGAPADARVAIAVEGDAGEPEEGRGARGKEGRTERASERERVEELMCPGG
jgi:hypothetical protein